MSKAGGPSVSMRQAALAASAALVLGLAVTSAVAWALSASIHAESNARFEGAVRRLEYDVQRRINQAAYGLRGLAAAYVSVGELDTARFRDWVAARDLQAEFPGVPGFGMIHRIERADLAAFVLRKRSEEPGFEVKSTGTADDVYVVSEIEPRGTNLVAWGVDLGQEAVRRKSFERAIATGQITLTDRVSLFQDVRRRAGWLMVLPVFRKGEDPLSEAGRRRALVGLLYAPIIAANVLADVRRTFESEVDFRLYDGPVRDGQLLFDSADDPLQGLSTGARGGWDTRQLRATRTLEMGGQLLTLDLASTPELDASSSVSLPVNVALVGALLSALLALSVWQLASGRRRAEAIAVAMTADLSKAAQDLSASEAFLEQAQRIANVGGWEVDLENLSLRLSAQTLRLFDLPPDSSQSIDQFIGFFVPQSQELIERATQVAVRDGTPWDLELKLVSAARVERWVRTVGRVERRGDRSVRLIGTLQDISDRKQAQEALQASEQFMRVVTDNLPGRVGYWTKDLRCVFANSVFGDTFGKTQDEMIGHTLREVVGEERYHAYLPEIQAVLAGKSMAFEREETVAGGAHRTMFVHYIADIRDGELQGFFVLALDVTEQKQAREAARQAAAAKGQFLANTSHELRTPMNAIIGMLALLRNTGLSPRQLDYAQKADDAARSLLGLLNDILDFSKVEAGKLVLDPRPFQLEVLMRDVSVILSANLRSQEVEILFDIDPAVPHGLIADDMRLRQVLINLGGNAVKFTEHGEVVIGVKLVERDGDLARLRFSVKDTGIGIADDQRSRIFEGFEQAEASTVRKYGGTGLGLAISQRLVALMGGTLQLDSELGRGSRFHFTIELRVDRAEPPQPPTTTDAAAQPLAGLRLLVVEDNLNNQQVARELLASRGAQVDIADDGRQALDRVTANPRAYDLVLMDVQMPVMDGYTATREIRKAGIDALPIVAMTANAMTGDREACLAAGMQDHVGKPFDLDALVSAVLRHVQGAEREAAAPAYAPVAADVDLAAAVQRLGGDVGFYQQLYPSIRADVESMFARLDKRVDAIDREEAGRLFHTMKGLAGTLGATGFARAAAQAEAAMCAAAPPGPDAQAALVASVRQAYQAACALIDDDLLQLDR